MSIHTQCPSCNKQYNLGETSLWKKAKCASCSGVFTVSSDTAADTKTDTSTSITQPSSPAQADMTIKPHKTSFILFNGWVFLFGVVAVLSLIVWMFFTPSLMITVIAVILAVISYGLTLIKYNKESYTITATKIIYNSGTLFSDNSVEVKLDKVSIVGASLPFVQHKIFKTGNIDVQTAGSSSSEIAFSQINDTTEVYNHLQKMMQKNGFQLQQDELVQEAKPHILGVVWEIFWAFIWNLFVLIYVIWGLLERFWIDSIIWLLSKYPIIYFIVFIYVWLVAGYIYIKFMDLKKREYSIFKDTIVYEEWFLSKHFAFIPMENVADTENKQWFFSKIFGLHDIVVSCQWENNQVIFKNMTDWEKMMKSIKYLKDNIIPREKDVTTQAASSSSDSKIGYIDKTESPLNYNKEFKAEYKMDFLRTTIWVISSSLLTGIILFFIEPSLSFVVLPIIIVGVVIKMVAISFTTFIVDSSSIEKKFSFLSNNHNSFSVEKITSVIIKESLLDKALGTCSIKFYSIGSQTPITFANIKKTTSLQPDILSKVGINNGWKEELIQDLKADFNLINYFKANIIRAVAMILVLICTTIVFIIMAGIEIMLTLALIFILVIVICVIFYVYNMLYFAVKRYIREVRENFVFSRSGIIFIEKKYSLLRHIKGIKTKKYPLSTTGDITLNISWEEAVAQDNGKKKMWVLGLLGIWSQVTDMIISSNSFNCKYTPNVFETHNSIDTILNMKEIDTQVQDTASQDIWNSVLGLGLLTLVGSVFTVWIALIPGLILIGVTIWSIKVKYYNFEKDRVLFGSWIIYKKRHSILYRKFNFIDKNQWMINKIFKNWNVGIYTLWSWNKEMWIKDIDNYTAVYDLLKTD